MIDQPVFDNDVLIKQVIETAVSEIPFEDNNIPFIDVIEITELKQVRL